MSTSITHQPSESFVKEVLAVSEAEARAKKRVEEAQSAAAALQSESQAKAVEVAAAAGDRAVAEKNAIIASARKGADEQIRRLTDRANARARELASRRLTEAAAQDIADSL